MVAMKQEDFLAQYTYGVVQDFNSTSGIPHDWIDGDEKRGRRFWGQENASITLTHPAIVRDSRRLYLLAADLSPDDRFLAVACARQISIYNVQTREKVSEFGGSLDKCTSLAFSPSTSQDGYVLAVENRDLSKDEIPTITFWRLDGRGELEQDQNVRRLNYDSLANQALDAILPSLSQNHGIDRDSRLLKPVLRDFSSTLASLYTQHREELLNIVTGKIARSARECFSSDGESFLYIMQYSPARSTTQWSADGVQEIVVYDIKQRTACPSLRDTDYVVWVAFSPDNRSIASASVYGPFRIWDAASGLGVHFIGSSHQHGWSGQWFPDSSHVLLAGEQREPGAGDRYTPFVAVYNRETGEQTARFEHADFGMGQIMHFAISCRNVVAFAQRQHVWTWDPFAPPESAVTRHMELAVSKRLEIGHVWPRELKWADQGKKLLLEIGDGTIEVHDFDKACKWLLQRPKGLICSGKGASSFWVPAGDPSSGTHGTIVAVHDDATIRYWTL